MITSKQLIYDSLSFHEVPRVPYVISFTVPARENILKTPQGRELYEKIDNDFVKSQVVEFRFGISDNNGRYIDEYGVEWNRTADPDIGMPTSTLTPENFDDFSWPQLDKPNRFYTLEKNLARYPDKFQIIAFDGPLYERAWYLRGLENLLMDFISNTEFAEKLLDTITDYNVEIMKIAFSRYPEIDGVYFGDDYGTQRGLVMGYDLWQVLIKPRLKRLYGTAKTAGKKVFIHSCGKVQELFRDFIEIGVDCFNPFQPEVMDTHQLLDEYYGKLSFHGGLGIQSLLPHGTIEEVEKEVDYLLMKGQRGGYIIATSHAIPGDSKVENICAMLNKILNQS